MSSKPSPQVLSVLRIITALLFIEHGLMKLFHFPAAMPGVSDPLPPLLMMAGVIEVVGGMLVAVGLYASVAAFICSGEMAVAYLMIHAPQSFWPALSHGDSAILFCFVFFYLAIAGPGPWTLDAVISAAELRDEARTRAANARLSPAQFAEYQRLLGEDRPEGSSERARLTELLTLRNRVTEQEVDEQLVLIRRWVVPGLDRLRLAESNPARTPRRGEPRPGVWPLSPHCAQRLDRSGSNHPARRYIGYDALIGAGSVVTRDTPAGLLPSASPQAGRLRQAANRSFRPRRANCAPS